MRQKRLKGSRKGNGSVSVYEEAKADPCKNNARKRA